MTWCGVLPDIDGIGLVIDGANHLLGRPDNWYYGIYHHAILHGLFAALLLPAILCIFAIKRLKVFLAGVLAVHLHLLCDLVGSRGPAADDVWPLHYLAPFSHQATFQWSGQWPLNAWQNIAFTVLLLAYAFVRACRSGYSPVEIVSLRADSAFVEIVRNRWRKMRTGLS